jgi:hypothetical protein
LALSYLFSILVSVTFGFFITVSSALASASEFCGSDEKIEALFPSYQVVMDWGLRIDNFYIDYHFDEGIAQKRAEIEYEYDERILYDEEPISLALAWQGCESFIGKQEECSSDKSYSLLLSPEQLRAELESRQGIVNNNPENVIEFPPYSLKELDPDWQPSESPIIETMFNMNITSEELELLGDFKQLNFRQAIRVTIDIDPFINSATFEDILVPSRFRSKSGLFINTKTIFKTSYLSDSAIERNSPPYRAFIENSIQDCDYEACGFEYWAYDTMSVKEVLTTFNHHNLSGLCLNNEIGIGGVDLMYSGNLDRANRAVLHFEIQTSIINTKEIENFNPLDYLDRDLTLPSKKDAGSLYYLLIGLMMLALKRRSKKLKQRSS